MKKNAKNLKRVSLASAAILTAFALPTVVCPNQSTTVHADEVTGSQESATGQDSLDSMKNQVEQDKQEVDKAQQDVQNQQQVVDQTQTEYNQVSTDYYQKSDKYTNTSKQIKPSLEEQTNRYQEEYNQALDEANQAQQNYDNAKQEVYKKKAEVDEYTKHYQDSIQANEEIKEALKPELEDVNKAQAEYDKVSQKSRKVEAAYDKYGEDRPKSIAELEADYNQAKKNQDEKAHQAFNKEKEVKELEKVRDEQAKKTAEEYYKLSQTKNPRVELPEEYDVRNNKEHTGVINFNSTLNGRTPHYDKNVNASEEDFNNIVDIQNPTDEQIKEINEFIGQIVNDVRSQLGNSRVDVNTAEIKEAELIAKDNEAHNSTNAVYLNSTNHPTVGYDVEYNGVSYGVGVSNAFQVPTSLKKKTASMAEIKEDLFNTLMEIFFSPNAYGYLRHAETLAYNGYNLGAYYAFFENGGNPISQLNIVFGWSDDNPLDSADDNVQYMDNYRKVASARDEDTAKAVQKAYDDDVNASSAVFRAKSDLAILNKECEELNKKFSEAEEAYQSFGPVADVEEAHSLEIFYLSVLNRAYERLDYKIQELTKNQSSQDYTEIKEKRDTAIQEYQKAIENATKCLDKLATAHSRVKYNEELLNNSKESLAYTESVEQEYHIALINYNNANKKLESEKKKLEQYQQAYQTALNKYNTDKNLYDTLVKAQEENQKHNTPSEDVPTVDPTKGSDTPSEDVPAVDPTKGQDTPSKDVPEVDPTKGSETPSEDVPTVDPTKGQDTPAPSQGQDTPAPSQGQDTPAPSQGQDTPAPSQGQDTPAPSQGQDTPAPSQGQDTPAPSRGQTQPVLNKIVDTPAFEVKATDCFDSTKVTPDQIRGYLEDPGFIKQNPYEDYTAPEGYEEDPTVKGGYVNIDDGTYLPASIAIRFYRPITTPAPTTPDTPNRGTDTPNRGTDTPSRGADIPNSQTEGTSRNVNTTPVVAEGQIKTIKKTVKPIEKTSSISYGNSSYVAPTSIKKDSLATQSLDNKQNDDKSSLPSTGETNTLSTLLSLSGITLLLSLFGIKAYRKN
ncbi:hypothetical protein E0E02_02815 [Streptococcus sp. KCJ4932]|uniref:hypothetical protein n=1 Tax=Streptococcus sp. KCJ4932 TaxID=2545465 RepID=UPI001054F758|nr:hypothetical protein [Streptococcus sp. KCJ4932]TDE68472.1 hypothetical protein E0E02_02815 [Streptococcus sp. KCJ4932]